MKTKLTTLVVVVLAASELVLVLLSWVLSAMSTGYVRSLLSSEGIRWFLGHYAEIVLSPLLVWIVLLSVSCGVVSASRVLASATSYRERMGRRVALTLLLLYVAAVLSLVLVPHAILLSASGSVLPSPFSKAFVPIVAFGMLIGAVAYGVVARTLSSLRAIIDAMLKGISMGAPFLLCYLLLAQFVESLRFVFGG